MMTSFICIKVSTLFLINFKNDRIQKIFYAIKLTEFDLSQIHVIIHKYYIENLIERRNLTFISRITFRNVRSNDVIDLLHFAQIAYKNTDR